MYAENENPSGFSEKSEITAKGKVKRAKAFHSHLLSSKTPKMKRRLSKSDTIHHNDMKRIKALLPYS